MTQNFDETKHPRTGDGKFASKGPAAEETGVQLTAEQRPAPLKRAGLEAMNRSARELVRLVESGDLELSPPYQRGSVWTTAQQRGLVKSYAMGVPIPAVILNHRNDESPSWYYCVDGKQRIEATSAWFKGELEVPAHWFAAEDVEESRFDEQGNEWVAYTGLSLPEQRGQGTRWTIPTAEGRMADEREEAELYGLVNGGGTAQTPEDMARAARIAEGR